MRKVYGIGETVLDIIFNNDQPIGAIPGGSVFNAMISLGRCGVPTEMISETGDDRVGRNTLRFLNDNNVGSQYVTTYPGAKSPVSLAFLNENNDAEYIFYKDHPNDKLEMVFPKINRDDIVLFGSYYSVNPVIRQPMATFLQYAKEKGAILYYDVNFRSSHKDEVIKLTANILENLEFADIVRGSDEDFRVMFKKEDADKVYRGDISFYCKNFIYTRGVEPTDFYAVGNFFKQYSVKHVETVSTIGAGDNFNAGFVYGLLKHNITLDMLNNGIDDRLWDKVIECAQAFAANACQTISNSVSKEFGAALRA